MLTRLRLKDLILIEEAEIEFARGLNIFTGETGSGKSAILSAIRLISGERAESEWVRDGALMAVVEAHLFPFPLDRLREIQAPEPGEPLKIRRELHKSGKSRCFIEDQLVPAGFLRELMGPLVQRVDQSSSLTLLSSEEQLEILDAFAGCGSEAERLAALYSALLEAQKELKEALSAQESRARGLDRAKSDLEMIEETGWKKEEEESLSRLHLLLTHAQELSEKIGRAAEGLSSLSPRLRQMSYLLESTVPLDAELASPAGGLKTASIELEEAERFLRSYASRVEADPARLAAAEKRIGAIETLKKRFGPSWDDVERKKNELSAEIDRLLSLDETVASLEQNARRLEEETKQAARELSEKRQKAAPLFNRTVLEELRSLNLPSAAFQANLEAKSLSGLGIDAALFLFSANPGLPPLPLDQATSGGELSRLLLAIKIVLADKEKTACLVFDEIDSNVGGQTAAVLGEKLQKLSKHRQIVCVTHFVQVARCALRHFAVSKVEKGGRAKTLVDRLDAEAREKEYARMLGSKFGV